MTIGAITGHHDQAHDRIPALLIVLTVTTGLVDAVSFLGLGHVFVANMTGNIVFIGFAAASAEDFTFAAPCVAIATFLVGSAIGGRLAITFAQQRHRFVAAISGVKFLLVGAALAVAVAVPEPAAGASRYGLIALLAIAMGIQTAGARKLSVPDLTTTVLTMVLTGLAADWGGGESKSRVGRRILAVLAMCVGAAVGAYLIFRSGIGTVLALVVALFALTGAVALWLSYSAPDAAASG